MTGSPLHPLRSRWIASVLGGAGLVVLALSLLLLYVGRILVRDDSFAARVSDSLDDPRVAEFVALRITDVLIEQQPDLTALRPILVVVTRGVVTSAPFRAMARPAVRKAHEALLSSTTEQVLLSIFPARGGGRELTVPAGANAAVRSLL